MGGVVPDNTEGHEWVGVQTGRLESKSFKKRPEGGVNMANDLVSLYIPKQRNWCVKAWSWEKARHGENLKRYVCLEGRARYTRDLKGEQGTGGAASWAGSEVPGLCELCPGRPTSCSGEALDVLPAGADRIWCGRRKTGWMRTDLWAAQMAPQWGRGIRWCSSKELVVVLTLTKGVALGMELRGQIPAVFMRDKQQGLGDRQGPGGRKRRKEGCQPSLG